MSFFNNIFGGLLSGSMMQPPPTRNFEETLKCFPISAAINKERLEDGNKIVLPPSALIKLSQLNIESSPMLFRVVNPSAQKMTHCGVMEFDAPEGVAYLPMWMMQMLSLQDGEFSFFRRVDLKKGQLVKLQPHFTKFTELSNPRVVLERALRNYSCLTRGDTLCIHYDEMIFPIDVVEVQPDGPGHAIQIVDVDLKVDFDEPKDYAQYMKQKEEEKKILDSVSTPIPSFDEAKMISGDTIMGDTSSAQGFANSPLFALDPTGSSPKKSGGSDYFKKLGSGHRLKDKVEVNESESSCPPSKSPVTNDTVSVVKGQWRYIYSVDPKTKARKLVRRVPAKEGSSAFSGSGNSLN